MAGLNIEHEEHGITGINVTPLVDIMLVLLIVFMVASNYMVKESIPIELPKAATGGETVGEALAFEITADGTLHMGQQPTTKEEIAAACRRAKGQPDAMAFLAADASVPHGRVTALTDFVRLNGVANSAINISPSPDSVL